MVELSNSLLTTVRFFIFTHRAFMIDRDMKEMNALRDIFPNSAVLLCWFHILQVNKQTNKATINILKPGVLLLLLWWGILLLFGLTCDGVLQAVHRWMVEKQSGVSGKDPTKKSQRSDVLNYLRRLKSCTTVSIMTLSTYQILLYCFANVFCLFSG